MKLKICNIGKVIEADIDINGITVIAGENNTGKSTVGKTLFSIFQTYFNLKNKIIQERYNSLKDLLDDGVFFRSVRREGEISFSKYQEILNENIERLILLFDDKQDRNSLEKDAFLLDVYGDDIKNKVDDIIQRLQITSDILTQNILTRTFKEEFNKQINYIFDESNGEVDLEIKNGNLSLSIADNEIKLLKPLFDLSTEIIYIDNPLISDDRDSGFIFDSDIIQHHSDYLRNQFRREGTQNAIEQVLVSKRLELINKMFSNIYDWRLVTEENFNSNEKKINFKNLSSGLKSFYILKKLIENGTIKNRNTIILDEPEVHLHPEWQLLYAEILVILQVNLDLHILINTHSPYFLNAIEVFSSKYRISDKCSYYLAENEGVRSKITDVTNNIEAIYQKLSRPLQTLENIRGTSDD